MLQQRRLQRLIGRLQARAQPPLPAGLIALIIEGTRVGDVQPEVARFLADKVDGFTLNDQNLTLGHATLDFAARSKLLAQAAEQLRDAGMISGWRDEVLSVGNPRVAVVERAACRPLGITTNAVHLNAYVAADTLLVSRRAAHKQIDPGLWDNLVGGMVPADETLEQALAREAWEEAGLRLDRVRSRSEAARFTCAVPFPRGCNLKSSIRSTLRFRRTCSYRIAMGKSMQSTLEKSRTSSQRSSATSSPSSRRWSRWKALRAAVTLTLRPDYSVD